MQVTQVAYTLLPNVQGEFKDLKRLLLMYGLVNKIRYTDNTKTFKSITQYAKHLQQNKLIIELCFFFKFGTMVIYDVSAYALIFGVIALGVMQ